MARNIAYGGCASCGFPIWVQDGSPVSCPFCSTINQPEAGGSNFNIALLALLAVAGIIILSKE